MAQRRGVNHDPVLQEDVDPTLDSAAARDFGNVGVVELFRPDASERLYIAPGRCCTSQNILGEFRSSLFEFGAFDGMSMALTAVGTIPTAVSG